MTGGRLHRRAATPGPPTPGLPTSGLPTPGLPTSGLPTSGLERRDDAGGATILVVAMAGVLMFVLVALAAVGGLVTAQRRAQSAADLTALAAAASDEAGACAEAHRVASANAASLEGCETEGSDVRVRVSVDGPRMPGMPGRDGRVTAEARAGPG